MKKTIIALCAIVSLASCSEGQKSGILQKVSHKTICDYWVMEVAYEGGRMVSDGKSGSYENTQSVEVTKEQADALSSYLGQRIVFSYHDVAFAVCGESKKLDSFRLASPAPAAQNGEDE